MISFYGNPFNSSHLLSSSPLLSSHLLSLLLSPLLSSSHSDIDPAVISSVAGTRTRSCYVIR